MATSNDQRPDKVFVFINYRREDSAGHAGRLYDDLVRRFSGEHVFIDVADIPAGVDFGRHITDAVARCNALVALIGPRWLEAAGPDGTRRLDDAGDYVRMEIEAALERDVLVVPVLLQGARMPRAGELAGSLQALAKRNSLQLRDASWHRDVDALADGLARVAAVPEAGGLRGESEAFWTSAPAEVELPYLGLRAFEAEDARFYFGREAEVNQLVELLRRERFLAVFGPSGSGKSSLVRAGLTRALQDGAISSSASWPLELVRLGPRPLETLAARIQRNNPQRAISELVDALAADRRTLHLESTAALGDAPPGTRIVWIVDQAEELFTLCQDEGMRLAAIDNLVYAGTVSGGSTDVVFAMRADFYQRCAAYPDLAQAISRSQFLVTPMSEAAIRRAIEEPARAVGLSFEPGLVDTILADVTSEPGALPLLEHALFELFERRRGRTMTLEGYRGAGGVDGALAKRAEQLYEELDDSAKAVVRRIMLRLTQPGEGTIDTRRRSSFRDLPSDVGEVEPVRHVVDELADARLLTVGASDDGAEPVVEIAHEALIRAWPRVRGWIEESREAMVVQRRIADAAVEWERLGRSPDALLRGVRLSEARAWQGGHEELLNELERFFLRSSVEAAESEVRGRERRRRLGYALATSLIAFFVVLSGVALLSWRDAATSLGRAVAAEAAANDTIRELQANQKELDRQRRLALGRSLLAEARRPDVSSNLAMLLSLEGERLAGGEANELLLGQLLGRDDLVGTRQFTDIAPGTSTAVSPDRSTFAFVRRMGARDAIVFRDTATNAERTLGEMQPVFRLEFSPDGRTLAASGTDLNERQGVVLWDVSDGSTTFLPSRTWSAFIEFSADGRRIATDVGDGLASITVWDVATAKELLTVDLEPTLSSFALNHDGTRLAIDTRDAQAIARIDLWDVAAGTRRAVSEEPVPAFEQPVGLAFGGTGDTLAVVRPRVIKSDIGSDVQDEMALLDLSDSAGRARVFDLGSFHPVAVGVAPHGSTFAGIGNDVSGVTELLIGDYGSFVEDTESGFSVGIAPLRIPERLWFGENGATVSASDGSGSIATWTIEKKSRETESVNLPPVAQEWGLLAYGPGPSPYAVFSRSEIGLQPVVEVADPNGQVHQIDAADGRSASFGADGRLLAMTSADGFVLLRLDAPTWRPDRLVAAEGTISVALSPDSRWLAVTRQTGDPTEWSLELRDASSGTLVSRVVLSERPTAVAFGQSGQSIIVATTEGSDLGSGRSTIAIYPVEDLTAAPELLSHGPGPVDALWGGSGETIAASFEGIGIATWDPSSGRISGIGGGPTLATGAGGTDVVLSRSVIFTPDGMVVARGSNRAWLWALADVQVSVETRACEFAGRNLTAAEWQLYLPGESQARTCMQFP